MIIKNLLNKKLSKKITYDYILNLINISAKYLLASIVTGIILLFAYETLSSIFHIINISTGELTCHDPIFVNECDKKLLEEILDFLLFVFLIFLLIRSYFKPITWKTVFIHISYFFLGVVIMLVIDTQIMYSMQIWQSFIHSNQY